MTLIGGLAASAWHDVRTGSLLGSLMRSSMLRDLARLGSGALFAQIILAGSAPLILRLYDPDDFGLYTLVYGLVMLLSLFGSCRIEALIVSVPDRITAVRMLAAIFCIGAAIAVLLSCAVVAFHLLAGQAFPQWQDRLPLLWPVPFAVLVQLTASGLRYHAIRMQRFAAVAAARVARAVVFVAGSTAVALLWRHAGGHGAFVLLACQIAGDLLALLIQFRSNGRAAWIALLRPRIWQSLAVTRRHARMLGAMTASQILGDLCQQMTVWTATFAYGAAQAGLYVLAYSIVSVPSVILAAPLADVLFQRLSRRYAEAEPLAPLVIRSTLILAAAAALPFAALVMLGPRLMPPLFGPQWAGASQSIAILAVGAYLFCVTTPAGNVLVTVQAHGFIVLRQVLQTLAVLLCAAAAAFGLVSYTGWLVILVTGRSLVYLLEFAASCVLACTDHET